MSPLSNAATRDIETLIHPYTNLATHREVGPTVVDQGKGIYIWDSEGKQYIEGLSGLWCTSLGYGNEELIETATAQMRKMSYTHIFGGKSHDPAIELAEKLKEIAPVPMSKVFFTCSGSEANDTQVKLIWYYNNALGRTKKKKIISRLQGYHGVTIASASLTGLPANHRDFDLPIANVLHAECPHHYRFAEPGESEEDFATRLADNLEKMIQDEDPDTVAAFIAEPIMGAGGVIIPPATYFEKIQAVLDKYDVLFIDDEVICGFGRTGNMWGAETFNMKPSTISTAKAITSAYMPVGAILIPEDIYQAMLDESRKIGTFGHGFTYSGHPVGAAVAIKTIEIYQRDNIIGHTQEVSKTFEARMASLSDHPLVGQARAKGMIGAVELVADKATKRPFHASQMVPAKVVEFAQEEGLIVRNVLDNVALCPPLIITEEELNTLFDRLETALNRAEAWVSGENLRAA